MRKKLLFAPNDAKLAEVSQAFANCGRRAAIVAALTIAEKYCKLYELAEERHRSSVREAMGAAVLWAKGRIKMPAAKVKILAAHSAARAAYSPTACAAARAVAQAASVVHTPKHAMGVVCYGLTAVAIAKNGDTGCEEVDREIERIKGIIDTCAKNPPEPEGWADFLLTKEERADRRAKAKQSLAEAAKQAKEQPKLSKEERKAIRDREKEERKEAEAESLKLAERLGAQVAKPEKKDKKSGKKQKEKPKSEEKSGAVDSQNGGDAAENGENSAE